MLTPEQFELEARSGRIVRLLPGLDRGVPFLRETPAGRQTYWVRRLTDGRTCAVDPSECALDAPPG